MGKLDCIEAGMLNFKEEKGLLWMKETELEVKRTLEEEHVIVISMLKRKLGCINKRSFLGYNLLFEPNLEDVIDMPKKEEELGMIEPT